MQSAPEERRLDVSIEDFEAKFREAFDREMTADERRYFNLSKPKRQPRGVEGSMSNSAQP